MNDRIIYLVTGPIGAGKSTYSRCLIEYFGLSALEYISADLYYSLYFQKFSTSDGEAYAKAKKYCAYKLEKAMAQGRSFIWETVVAKETKLATIKRFISRGYLLRVFYIGMGDYNVSIDRVAKRHAQGWYDVPEQKTIDRHRKSMACLNELIQIADSIIIIDSASEQGKIVLWKEKLKVKYYDSACAWLPGELKKNRSMDYEY